MRNIFCFLFFILASLKSFSQAPTDKVNYLTQQPEDILRDLSEQILTGTTTADRLEADSVFTRLLVKSLKAQYSFFYPFDSLTTISKIYAPDSSFRIFTWQVEISESFFRQHGAIQMNTSDGSLKLFPLIDKSDITIHYEDTIADNKGWMGAVYYNIIMKEYEGKKYYTLLGYDENNIRSNKKVIEILDMSGEKPLFGKNIFSIGKKARYVMEYQKAAGAKLNYDQELDMILMEHLISQTNEPTRKWTLIGDGDYQGFKWLEGGWVFVDKVFDLVTPENEAPVPTPVTENKFLIPEETPAVPAKKTTTDKKNQ